MDKKMKIGLVQAVIVLFFYVGVYGLASFLDPYLAKTLIVHNILLYTPLALFSLGLVDGYGQGLSIMVPALAILLFPLTIFSFGEWIWLYQVIYSLSAVVGMLFGALLCHRKNKKSLKIVKKMV
ncbi:TPA: hypothetical protein ACGO28_001340 [Streptococcus suis]